MSLIIKKIPRFFDLRDTWLYNEMMKYIIKEASIQDTDFIVESQLKMAYETEKLKLSKDLVQLGVESVFKDPSRGQYYIAVDNTTQAPVACSLTTYEWSDWRNSTIWWIQSVFVNPEERGKGAFRAIYHYLKEKCESEKQSAGLRLYVDKSNTNAQKVYEKMGMTNQHYEMFEWIRV